MKKMKLRAITLSVVAAMLLSGCGNMNNTGKGALIGTGGGALLGAGIGALAGGGKGAIIGAAVGGAVGAGTGAVIGNKMDKQKAELEKIQGAQVNDVTDSNGIQAIKVTFADGILFQTGKSDLSPSSKNSMNEFARSLVNNPDTDITVYGHTDNTGTRELNQKLSEQRAQAVKNYFVGNGVTGTRIKTQGLAFDMPIGDNSTAAGRAENRRVEVFITASAEMIKKAEQGK